MTIHRWLVAVAALMPAALSLAQSISVREEIRYPTAYREQRIGRAQAPGVGERRVPAPTAFETRAVGAQFSAPVLGVVRNPVVVPASGPTYHVVFADGREARFVDGRTTVVRGVPYQGLGYQDGVYRALNLETRIVASFRMPKPSR